MSILKLVAASAGLPILAFVSWNLGVDFGNDVGFCVGYSVGDQPRKVPVAENPFCKAVKPDDNRALYAVRSAYLYAIGDHP